MFEHYRPKILNKLSYYRVFGVCLKLESFYKDRIFDKYYEGASKTIVKSRVDKKKKKCKSLRINHVRCVYLFTMIFDNIKLQTILDLAIYVSLKSDNRNQIYSRLKIFLQIFKTAFIFFPRIVFWKSKKCGIKNCLKF